MSGARIPAFKLRLARYLVSRISLEDHGHQIPPTEGAGERSLLAEHGR